MIWILILLSLESETELGFVWVRKVPVTVIIVR